MALVIYDFLLSIYYFFEVKLKISINCWGQYTEKGDYPEYFLKYLEKCVTNAGRHGLLYSELRII